MLQLHGQQLTLQQIVDIAEGREQVVLADEARVRVEQARQVVQNIVTKGALFTASIQGSASCQT